MNDYDYKDGKRKVNEILNSSVDVETRCSIPKESSSDLTFENGIKTKVAALFIDIRDSTEYFKNNGKNIAKIMRAFTSEIIDILSSNENYREIGIRGDCVYAIYSVSDEHVLLNILSDAIWVNTFQKMFQKILKSKGLPEFKIGIGLGYDDHLIVAKAGKKGTGINDLIWIGDAVIDASKLSSQGNADGFNPIVIDENYYLNIKSYGIISLFEQKKSDKLGEIVYHANIIKIDFNNWINEGM